MPISDDQFKEYINKMSDSYEAIKDAVYGSDLNPLGQDAERILGHLQNFRDIACIALRESHATKNFDQN